MHNGHTLLHTSVLCQPPPPTPKTGGVGALVFDECQQPAGRNWEGSPPPRPLLRRITEMRGQNVQKMLERVHFWRIFHGILSEFWPKIRFFSGASRAVNNSLTTTWLTSTIRSKSRLCYNNACWKMSKAHQKTHESHPGRQARTHSTKNNVFRSVLEIVFWCRRTQAFSMGWVSRRGAHYIAPSKI